MPRRSFAALNPTGSRSGGRAGDRIRQQTRHLARALLTPPLERAHERPVLDGERGRAFVLTGPARGPDHRSRVADKADRVGSAPAERGRPVRAWDARLGARLGTGAGSGR